MSSTTLCPLIDPLTVSIDDALQTAWQAFRREENRTESDTDRQRLERLRNRLSDLMKELETQR
jgi:hypothetical protein